ncbi:Hypothetical predicted protein, partial [Paramuricea clavata]
DEGREESNTTMTTSHNQNEANDENDADGLSLEKISNSPCKNANICNKTLPYSCNCRSLAIELESVKWDIVILQNSIESSNNKNTNSSEELSKLQLELKEGQHKNRLLVAHIKTVEEERDSLRLALKLLMQDHTNKYIAVANDRNEQGKAVTGKLQAENQIKTTTAKR